MALQVSDRDRDVEDLEIDLLLTAIVRRYGYDFRNYAPASLRRRIRRMQGLEAVPTISALQARILRDTACMERFIANLSVSVTAMFRDPEFYRVLRVEVVPMLRTYPFVRVWHVGCATGEEVYSMAILLEEEGIYDRCRLYATDISDRALRRAAKGVFDLDRMKDNTSNYLRSGGVQDFSAYYTADARSAIFRESLRRNMIFSQHNLVSDGPFNEFNLVLCRNVLIYFDATLRERVHELLHSSLAPFGVLGLGVKETVHYTQVASCYRAIGGLPYLFRKEQ
jgi:chemotaxis protein methyltransferase CheR